jgi:hypothetical protein
MMAGEFAAVALTLYAAHHVGDYWIQTDRQARHKGDAGAGGVLQCVLHICSYLATQIMMLLIANAVLQLQLSAPSIFAGLAVSGITHYLADRRERGLMFKLARLLPGKAAFLQLGVPRNPQHEEVWGQCPTCDGRGTSHDESTGGKCWDCRGGGMLPSLIAITDNPSLGTGAWALDQAWHIFWGVWVAALLVVTL